MLSFALSGYYPTIAIPPVKRSQVYASSLEQKGEIEKVGRDFFGLGNFVEVLHQNGFRSKYAHMGRIFVSVGDKVTSENTLGEVGLTGRTTGPHTHLEVTRNGNFVNPLALLPEIPGMPAVNTASLQTTPTPAITARR